MFREGRRSPGRQRRQLTESVCACAAASVLAVAFSSTVPLAKKRGTTAWSRARSSSANGVFRKSCNTVTVQVEPVQSGAGRDEERSAIRPDCGSVSARSGDIGPDIYDAIVVDDDRVRQIELSGPDPALPHSRIF